VTLRETDLVRFEQAFDEVSQNLLSPADLTRTLETDGALETGHMSLESARLLQAQIWGQGFPLPLFADEFAVVRQRILKDKHLKLTLNKNGVSFEAIQFNFAESVPQRIRAAYRLGINEYNGLASVQLMLEHLEPVAAG
jgi:single-stranded-DNA-specific exonuclease